MIDSGSVNADIDSLVTVNGVTITTGKGTRLVIDCESGEPIVTVDPVDPVDPPNPAELLVNSDFSNQLTGWLACNNISDISIDNNAAVIGGDECVRQLIEISQYQELHFSCEAVRLPGGTNGVKSCICHI